MPSPPGQPAPSRGDTTGIAGVSGAERDGWSGSAESLGLSNDFCRLCARTKQNETEIIRWKNAPYSRGTARCFLCMIFQGSTRYRSGQRFSKVISSRSEGEKLKKKVRIQQSKSRSTGQMLCGGKLWLPEAWHWERAGRAPERHSEQSWTWADGNLRLSAKSNIHKRFCKNLKNKESIIAKQAENSPTWNVTFVLKASRVKNK